MLLSVIQKSYHNEHLSTLDYETILEKHHVVKFTKGTFLLEHSQMLNCYYILLEGLVHAFVYDANGNQITINIYNTADVIIDVNALFQQKKTLENWQCLTDCTLLAIQFNDFKELFHNLYGFREWGRTWMAHALFELKERSMEMHTLTARERYEKLINQKPYFIHQVPLKFIASYLGITDSSLSRIRKELKPIKDK